MNFKDLNNSAKAAIRPTDAAAILEVDPRTVLRAIEEGTIPSIRVGRRVLIPRLPFLRMLTGETVETAA